MHLIIVLYLRLQRFWTCLMERPVLAQADVFSFSNQTQKFHERLVSLNLVPFLPRMMNGHRINATMLISVIL